MELTKVPWRQWTLPEEFKQHEEQHSDQLLLQLLVLLSQVKSLKANHRIIIVFSQTEKITVDNRKTREKHQVDYCYKLHQLYLNLIASQMAPTISEPRLWRASFHGLHFTILLVWSSDWNPFRTRGWMKSAFPGGGQHSKWKRVDPNLTTQRQWANPFENMKYMLETGTKHEVPSNQIPFSQDSNFLTSLYLWMAMQSSTVLMRRRKGRVRRGSVESMTSCEDKEFCYTLGSLEVLGKSLETENMGWLPQAIPPQPSDFGH